MTLTLRSLVLVVATALVACTAQPAGARCEQDLDCDQVAGNVCRNETEPTTPCQGASSCICCPSNPAEAATVPGCSGRIVLDSGVRE